MAASDRHELGFFLLRYVPDAVKEEFVNIGVVMVGGGTDAGYADVRFTRDWRRVLCLDPGRTWSGCRRWSGIFGCG